MQNFLFIKISYEVGNSIIEIKWIDPRGKEVTEASLGFHCSEDLVYCIVPLLFAVLFIEDAILFIF